MSTVQRKIKRALRNQHIAGTADVLSHSFVTSSASLKSSVQYGPEIKKSAATGVSAIIATSPTYIEPGTALAIFNNTASVQWINMNRAEDGTLTAPTGFANAFPLAPNSWTYLNMGENDTVQVSSGSVGIYLLADNSIATVLKATDPF